jgi:hypothetical protein
MFLILSKVMSGKVGNFYKDRGSGIFLKLQGIIMYKVTMLLSRHKIILEISFHVGRAFFNY